MGISFPTDPLKNDQDDDPLRYRQPEDDESIRRHPLHEDIDQIFQAAKNLFKKISWHPRLFRKPVSSDPTKEEADSTETKDLTPQEQEILERASELEEEASHAYDVQKDLATTEELMREVSELTESVYGPEHLETANKWSTVAHMLFFQGKFSRAIPIYEDVIRVQRQHLEHLGPEVLQNLSPLAASYLGNGDFEQALETYEELLDFYTNTHGPDHLLSAQALTNMAKALLRQGLNEEALEKFEQALAIQGPQLDRGHPDVIKTVDGMATCYKQLGEYEQARVLYAENLDALQQTVPLRHTDIAITHDSLAEMYRQLGEFELSRFHYEAALDISRSTPGMAGHIVALILNNLATLLKDQGDYQTAKTYFQEALEIRIRVSGPDHYLTGQVTNNLGAVERSLKNTDEALRLFEKAQGIQEKKFGPDHPYVATTLNNIALIWHNREEHDTALPLYERSLAIRENHFGDDSKQLIVTLHNMSDVYAEQGDFPEAWALHRRSKKIFNKRFVKGHLESRRLSRNATNIAELQGRDRKARRTITRSFRIAQDMHATLTGATSEREQMALIKSNRAVFDMYLRIFDRKKDTQRAYEAVLSWKGLVGQTQLSQRQTLFDAPEAQELFAELTETRREIANLSYKKSDPQKTREQHKQLDELTTKKESLERQLSQISSSYQQTQAVQDSTSGDVLASLPEDSVLIDFVRYNQFVPGAKNKDERYVTSYAAFVLNPKNRQPITRIELGAAEPIDQAIQTYREYLNSGQSNHFWSQRIDEAGQRVTQLMWQPLQEATQGSKTVFVVPDGAITGVSFAGLPSQADRYLVEDYTFGYLDNAKDITRFASNQNTKEPQTTAKSALLVGAANYQGSDQTESPQITSAEQMPSRLAACAPEQWEPLEATAVEVQNLKGLLAQRGYDVTTLTGDQASEQAILRQASQKTYLHFATHGFFAASDSCKSSSQSTGAGYNPMVMSGIVLANTQPGKTTEPKNQDNILTAEEIAGLDLRQADMVVLSACETGLGEVATGEGVLGLRRAFVQAGAQTLVMSLWQIPDTETQELMQTLYNKLLQDPGLDTNKLHALREAQLLMLAHNRERSGQGAPISWAGFIASGDWD